MSCIQHHQQRLEQQALYHPRRSRAVEYKRPAKNEGRDRRDVLQCQNIISLNPTR